MLASLHIILAFLLLYISLRYWVVPTQEALLPAVVAQFILLPLLIIGVLYFSFGSYQTIPILAWVGSGMLRCVGLIFILSMVIF